MPEPTPASQGEPQAQSCQHEEDQAQQDIAAEQANDEQHDRHPDARSSGISGWLWSHYRKRNQHATKTTDVEHQQQGDKVEQSQGSKLPTTDTRLLPILSGIICPFSVLLDIPGLTQRWYVRTDEQGRIVDTHPNGPVLDIGLSISLFLGVLANLALIWRFLEHRPRICTWISMVSLTLHDILNVLAVIIFAVEHKPTEGFEYNSAFWLTVASTAASLVCNVTLSLDLIRTKDFKKKGSGLTEKQRTLVVATMALLLYLGLGALIFHYLIVEIGFIDSLYFTICTITSVGFGDVVPISVGSRIFSFFYDPIGLILIAFTIAVARECLIESFEDSYRARRDQLAKIAKERKEERKRRHKDQREKKRRAGEEAERAKKSLEEEVEQGRRGREKEGRTANGARRDSHVHAENILHSLVIPTRAHLSPSASPDLSPSDKHEPYSAVVAVSPAAHVPQSPGSFNSPQKSWSWFNPFRRTPAPAAPIASSPDLNGGAPLRRTLSTASTMSTSVVDDSFRILKTQLHKEQRAEFRMKLGISVGLFLVFWLVGAAVFEACEGWTYFEGMWFGFVYFSTIGYGDFSPKTAGGRAFFVCWALLGIANMTLLISVLTESFSSRYQSTISTGRVKRAFRRAPALGGGTSGNSALAANLTGNPKLSTGSCGAAAELLQSEGYLPLCPSTTMGGGVGHLSEEKHLDPQELPEMVLRTLKGFHEHARFFMLGRTGDAPPSLRFLLDAADSDELNEKLERVLKGTGAASLADAGAQGDMKQYLFMIAYERQFDLLVDSAEHLSAHLATTEAELTTLREEKVVMQLEMEGLHARVEAEERERMRSRDGVPVEDPFAEPPATRDMEDREDEEEKAADRADHRRPSPPHRRSSTSSILHALHLPHHQPRRPSLSRLGTASGDLDVDLVHARARRRSSASTSPSSPPPPPSRAQSPARASIDTPGGSRRSSFGAIEEEDGAFDPPTSSRSATAASAHPQQQGGQHRFQLPHAHLPHPHMPHLPRRKSSLTFARPTEHEERRRRRDSAES
ncbi:hypothetical protein JCM11641_007717 [Rhodosporidiobolus odoratus]